MTMSRGFSFWNILPAQDLPHCGHIEQIAEAFTRVENKDVRYRFVIDFASSKETA